MYVLTIDQRSSRRQTDLVPSLLQQLNRHRRAEGLVRRFERTAGDEMQGVLESPELVVGMVVELLRGQGWSIGVGVGETVSPMPRSTRSGSGAAFVRARKAVNRAKSSPHRVCVVGAEGYGADRVEAVLWLISLVLRRRSERGWEVVDMVARGITQAEAAAQLGISPPAVSQRLSAAAWVEQQRGQALAVELLGEVG